MVSKKRKTRTKILTPQQLVLRAFLLLFLFGIIWIYEQWPTTELPSSSHPVALYAKEAKDDLRKTFLAAIQQAREKIVMVMYTLNDPVMIQALRKKAEEGVSVYIVVDGKESRRIREKLGPKVAVCERVGTGIVHQKMLAIDGKSVWLGSANMTYSSLRRYGNLLLGVESPHLADYVDEKVRSLPPKGRGVPFAHRAFRMGEQQGEIYFLPDDKEALGRVKECLRTAQKTVRVAMFTFTHRELAQELVAAKERGVDTQVVIDKHQGKATGAKIVDYLRTHGIAARLSRGEPLLHHKFCYIDGEKLIHGSANWTKAAFATNDDFIMIVDPLTEEQVAKMDRIWNQILEESDL